MSKLTPDHLTALENIPYLRQLPATELVALARVCEVRHVPREACVFSEGEAPAGLFLILRGRVRVVRQSTAGREQVLHEERAGATLAEVPVFDGGGYVATAMAVEDAELLFIPRMPLLDLLDRHPRASREVIRILGARVRKFAVLVEDLSLRPITERVAGYLLREVARAGAAVIEMPATRDQLAAHLGTVREEVSRALSQLKRQGVIELSARRVKVLDRTRLAAFAGSR